jgi:hypothetical protein
MPHIEYGPPGHRGVTTIMGVGADPDDDKLQSTLKLAGWASVGLWTLGLVIGSRDLKMAGFGAACATFAVQLIGKPKEEPLVVQTQTVPPQGCCL